MLTNKNREKEPLNHFLKLLTQQIYSEETNGTHAHNCYRGTLIVIK